VTTGATTTREAEIRYSHTQIGWGMLAIMGIALLTVLVVSGTVLRAAARPRPELNVVAVFSILLAVTAIVFSTLNVRVTRDTLVWRFGPGLLSWRIPLAEIATAAPTRLSIWAGLGIHWIGRGWVYNVSGRDAVEIVRVDGRVTFIGTDDAAGLAAALDPRRPPAP
jgi:hypothetical protein